jgi:hypothetical protein
MKLTETEYQRRVIELIVSGDMCEEASNIGEIVIYTGMYEWNDSSIHDEPDPNYGGE